MENMLHLAPCHASVPDCFVVPPDQLPPAASAAVSLPVVDMSGSHDEVRRAILDAGREFGFFQASKSNELCTPNPWLVTQLHRES